MFTCDELIAAAGVSPAGGVLPRRFPGGAVDSRQVQPGELFVALRGASMDGHRFIGDAVRAGAAAILCQRPDAEATARGVAQIVVNDPLEVLQRLANQHLRAQPHTRVIAITGSNGKTSVKEATAALLRHLGPTLKTEGNLNTETGVPLTLLRLNQEHQFAVIEMGAQWVGEISALCHIAPPDIAVVTVVGPEHLEFFGSMENVVKAESEAIASLPRDGIAILNDDDPSVRGMAKRTTARILTYGHRPKADVRALRTSGDALTGLRFSLTYGEQRARVRLNIPGEHAVTTALAAASVAVSYGMSLRDIAQVLGEIRPVKRRGEVKHGVNGTTLVDDTYNANRQSAIAAVNLLKQAHVKHEGRRWFVFGDMLELGAYSRDEHAAVGVAAADAVDELVLVGTDVQAASDAALRAGMNQERVHLYTASLQNTPELTQARSEAARYVRDHVREGDLVLVKGSLGTGMDAIVSELQESQSAPQTRSERVARPRPSAPPC